MKIRKQFKAEVAHRLVSSYSERCQSFHGHSYLFEIVLAGRKMNKDGMLMDFGEVKTALGPTLDAFDHSMVLFKNDPAVEDMCKIMDKFNMRYIIVPYNPTAENMAYHIYCVAQEMGLPIYSVRVHETATGWAEAIGCGGVDIDDIYYSEGIINENS